jgi:hypothetical protein
VDLLQVEPLGLRAPPEVRPQQLVGVLCAPDLRGRRLVGVEPLADPAGDADLLDVDVPREEVVDDSREVRRDLCEVLVDVVAGDDRLDDVLLDLLRDPRDVRALVMSMSSTSFPSFQTM